MRADQIPNIVTAFRIPLGLVIVFFLRADQIALTLCSIALLLAYITDLLDGILARKLNAVSKDGELWDSLADKAVYIGAVIALTNQGVLDPLIAWGLVMRDVAMYVSRISLYDKLHILKNLKIYSYAHCIGIYTTISLGIWQMFVLTATEQFSHVWLVNLIGLLTFAAGGVGSLRFIFMKPQGGDP